MVLLKTTQPRNCQTMWVTKQTFEGACEVMLEDDALGSSPSGCALHLVQGSWSLLDLCLSPGMSGAMVLTVGQNKDEVSQLVIYNDLFKV